MNLGNRTEELMNWIILTSSFVNAFEHLQLHEDVPLEVLGGRLQVLVHVIAVDVLLPESESASASISLSAELEQSSILLMIKKWKRRCSFR